MDSWISGFFGLTKSLISLIVVTCLVFKDICIVLDLVSFTAIISTPDLIRGGVTKKKRGHSSSTRHFGQNHHVVLVVSWSHGNF